MTQEEFIATDCTTCEKGKTDPQNCLSCFQALEPSTESADSIFDKLSETDKKYLLRRLLNVRHEKDYSILFWKHPSDHPREGSYVLLKQLDDAEGLICVNASYENGQFWYQCYSGECMEIKTESIRGWDYYPYNEASQKEIDYQRFLELLWRYREESKP